jgi:pyruvate,orthophosphate dikinase
VKFCHKIGLTYVSCSPYRVPVARLAAAQAAIADEKK